MKVLIAGGTGLIGSALARAMLADGHVVRVLTRNPEKASGSLPNGTEVVKWDGHTPEGWGQVMEDTDAVINLAGESITGEGIVSILTQRWTRAKKDRIIRSRVQAGEAITAAFRAAKKKPEVLVQSSAVGFYSPSKWEDLTEDSPAGDDFSAETCLAWEASTAEVEAMGVRRVVIRTGLVFTLKGGILPLMLLPFKLFVGGHLGSGKQPVPWIHISDEIEAIRFLIENKETSGPYNLTAPNPVDYAGFGRVASKALGRPYWLPVPGFVLRLALGEKADLVVGGQRALPKRLIEQGYKFRYEYLQDAFKDLLV